MTLDEARTALTNAYADLEEARAEARMASRKTDLDAIKQAAFRIDYALAHLTNMLKQYNTTAIREQHEQRVAQFGRGTYETA